MIKRRPLAEHFAASEITPTGCRIWPGCVSQGYAMFNARGAHRVVYETFVGPIPMGMTVDHICFNPMCVEPTHLRLLTNLANSRRHKDRPRIVPDSECVNGHQYTPANTYRMPSGGRDCRACIRERVRAYNARKAAAARKSSTGEPS